MPACLKVPKPITFRAKFKAGAKSRANAGLLASGKDYPTQTRKTFRFQVFEREGQPCGECGKAIVMDRIASRRLYWCPRCQH